MSKPLPTGADSAANVDERAAAKHGGDAVVVVVANRREGEGVRARALERRVRDVARARLTPLRSEARPLVVLFDGRDAATPHALGVRRYRRCSSIRRRGHSSSRAAEKPATARLRRSTSPRGPRRRALEAARPRPERRSVRSERPCWAPVSPPVRASGLLAAPHAAARSPTARIDQHLSVLMTSSFRVHREERGRRSLLTGLRGADFRCGRNRRSRSTRGLSTYTRKRTASVFGRCRRTSTRVTLPSAGSISVVARVTSSGMRPSATLESANRFASRLPLPRSSAVRGSARAPSTSSCSTMCPGALRPPT